MGGWGGGEGGVRRKREKDKLSVLYIFVIVELVTKKARAHQLSDLDPHDT